MKSLKRKILYSLLAIACLTARAKAAESHPWPAKGGDYELTKVLLNAFGSASMGNAQYETAIAFGEPAASHKLGRDPYVVSGYFGDTFDSNSGFRLLRSQVGDPGRAFYQNSLQIGAALNAEVTLEFSEGLTAASIDQGIHIEETVDHLGRIQKTPAAVRWSYDAVAQRVRISPESAWQGNTLYEIRITPALLSANGFEHDGEVRVRFLTLIDPSRDNVVLHPQRLAELAPAPGVSGSLVSGGLSVHLPPEALSDYAMVLFNGDPLNIPGETPVEVLREANRKAADAGGPYRTPVMLQEISVRSAAGEPLPALAKPAEIALAFNATEGWLQGLPAPVKVDTLSIWALDEVHRLWVKIPGSYRTPDGRAIAAQVPHFSVYALMGGPSGSASDVYAFPNPWRPFGPAAGDQAGQTGTLSGGVTFNNLPSECTIRIYTLSGERVRELRHSNALGPVSQEKWDGRTDGGQTTASGVYLWRVESDTDGKNGKLMVIR